ncbi:MAG: hypothetical protein CM1200mP8_1080 [Chloroflexota bacterium]|nr:MAG: hypothetical protein CM1200mP8_1080 [Chloroflexota bacterium]
MESILYRAIKDKDHGIGNFDVEINEDAMNALISLSGGDAE